MAEQRDEMKATGESGDEVLGASKGSGGAMGEQAGEAAREAGHQAHAAREAARQRMESMKGQVRQSAEGLANQTRRRAAELGQQAKEQGRDYIEQGKGRVVEQVEHVSHAIRSASGKLREENHEGIACYIDAMAEQVDRVSGYLRDRDPMALMDDARAIARRHPALLMGGMFVAGLALSRFLKASREQGRSGSRRGHDWERDEYGATYGSAGSSGEALYEAQSRYGESNLPVGATQNQPTGRYQPFQSRGMTSVTTADPTTPSSPAPSTVRTPETGPDQPTPSKTPESLNP